MVEPSVVQWCKSVLILGCGICSPWSLLDQIEHRFVSPPMPWLNFIASAARLAYQRSNPDLEYVHLPGSLANKSPLFSNRVSSRDSKILRSDSTADVKRPGSVPRARLKVDSEPRLTPKAIDLEFCCRWNS